jgi:hypothetical protein
VERLPVVLLQCLQLQQQQQQQRQPNTVHICVTVFACNNLLQLFYMWQQASAGMLVACADAAAAATATAAAATPVLARVVPPLLQQLQCCGPLLLTVEAGGDCTSTQISILHKS